MPASTKEGIVRTYVQDYLSKMDAVGSGGGVPPGVNGKNVDLKSATAAHLTHDMNSNRGEMMEYLRKHEVFGRVLGNINGLVEGALRG